MRGFTAILAGAAALLAVCGPAHAGWKWGRARPVPPVAYDLEAIDDVLATPHYDVEAIESLIRTATAEPISWRAEGFVPDRARKAGKGRRQPRPLRLNTAADDDFSPAWAGDFVGSSGGFAGGYDQWRPGRLTGSSGDYDIEFTPHAGFGLSEAGRTAEAGGTVRLGALLSARDGRSLGSAGRWHLFGAVSGQSVGWNFNNNQGPWRGLGLTHDRTSATIASAQAGVAWRKGAVMASLGYSRRKVRIKGDLAEWAESLDLDLFPKSDDAVAFTFSWLPR